MNSRMSVHVRIRIDFDSGASLGPGKVSLLEQIAQSGSLSQAARVLGLSYRRAWLLVDDINHAFDDPAVVTATGGRHGGGAVVTPFGLDLIKRYRKLEQGVEQLATRAFRSGANASKLARAVVKRRSIVRGTDRRQRASRS